MCGYSPAGKGEKMAITMRKAAMMPRNCNKTFAQAREDFFAEKKGAGIRESTLETYRYHLDYFFSCLADCDSAAVKLFTKDDYIFFLNFIKYDPDKNERTRQSYCRSIKAFLNWLMDNDYIEERFKVTVPKAQSNIKQTYTEQELKALLKDPRACSYSTYQTWVFINFCISTGLRLSSMLYIQKKDYEPTEQTVIVNHTKNGLPQMRWLNDYMCNILNEYIETFQLNDVDYLFCTSGGKRMSASSMQDNVRRYNHQCGVKKTSIHLFRHTFARKFLENGGSVLDLQKLLDHADINTTMKYARDYSIDVNKTTEIFNPQKEYSNVKQVKQFNRKKKMQ